MQKQNQDFFSQDSSWFQVIGEIEPNKIFGIHYQTQRQILGLKTEENSSSSNEPQVGKMGQIQQNGVKKITCKRQRQGYNQQDSELSSGQLKEIMHEKQISDQRTKSGSQTTKGQMYSKNYRQRKQQKAQSLQEENRYLRSKVHDLENRLREMELEMNRLKFTTEEKENSIEQLNEQFMTKLNVIMQNHSHPEHVFKSQYEPSDAFYHEFVEIYSKHGFAGSRKLEIINYYYNQIIDSILRDSQRYFCLMCVNASSPQDLRGLPHYEPINEVFTHILNPDQHKIQRLEIFQYHLFPMVNNFVQACKNFNSNSNQIVHNMQGIHDFLKKNYLQNFDLAKMRIVELQAWFEAHKYSKFMRNLRHQWLQQIKKDLSSQNQPKKNISGSKKKKLGQKYT